MAWQRRPLRLGFHESCIFRPLALAALDAAGIVWEMGADGSCEQAVEAMVSADLLVSARMRGATPDGVEVIDSDNDLPKLGQLHICVYNANVQKGEVIEALMAQLRCAYCD